MGPVQTQFERGNSFQMRITVGKEHYGILVSGAGDSGGGHRVKFSHKVPIEKVQMLVSRKVCLKPYMRFFDCDVIYRVFVLLVYCNDGPRLD
eukprot:SAG31_NODE_4056_length_3632_cov_37.393999_1_plen_92_part_00